MSLCSMCRLLRINLNNSCSQSVRHFVSMADLYDEVTMPVELRKAHQENDRAVMQAYGFPIKSTFTESQCVAELFKLYKEIAK